RHGLPARQSTDASPSYSGTPFAQKSHALPALHNKLVITPTKVGTYPIICTQLCGLGHALMRNRAIVLSVAAYDAWYKSAGKPTTPAGGSVSPVTLFTKIAPCGACHTFTPAHSQGKIGPDLDHLKAAAAKAGQPLEAYVRQSIEQPDAYITPGYAKGVMSASCCKQLSADQINQLVQYLVTNTK